MTDKPQEQWGVMIFNQGSELWMHADGNNREVRVGAKGRDDTRYNWIVERRGEIYTFKLEPNGQYLYVKEKNKPVLLGELSHLDRSAQWTKVPDDGPDRYLNVMHNGWALDIDGGKVVTYEDKNHVNQKWRFEGR